jgi:hypothetical protein
MPTQYKTIHFPDSHGNIVEIIKALIKEGVISLPEKDLKALTECLTTLNLETMLEGLTMPFNTNNHHQKSTLTKVKKLLSKGVLTPLSTQDNDKVYSAPAAKEETKSDDRPQPSKNEDQQSYIHKLNDQLNKAIGIIESIKLPVEDPETIYTLHSIGDNLADRAGVSILMLKLISHLNNGLGLKMLINFSNHDSEELKALKKNFDKKRDIWPSLVLDTTQGTSYSASQLLIALGIYDREDYTQLLLNYQALVKLFVFEMMPKSIVDGHNNGETKHEESSKEETELIIYTHAPFDITAIEQLAQLWLPKALQELKRNPRTLATALMAMNDKFSQVLDEYFQPIDNDILDAVLFNAVHSRLRTKPLWSNDEAGYKSILGKVHKETGTREITEEKKQVLCIKARTLLEAIIWNRRCSFEGLRNMPEFATSAFGHTGPCGVQILELKEANEKALNGIRSLERTVTNIKKIACLFILNCIKCTPPKGRAKAISDFLSNFVDNDDDFEFAKEYVRTFLGPGVLSEFKDEMPDRFFMEGIAEKKYNMDEINIYKLLDGYRGKPEHEKALKLYKEAIAKVNSKHGIQSAINKCITITTDEDSYRYIAGPLKNEILIKLAELVKSTSLQPGCSTDQKDGETKENTPNEDEQEDKLNDFQAFVAELEFPSMVHTTDSKMTVDFLQKIKLRNIKSIEKKLLNTLPSLTEIERHVKKQNDLTDAYTYALLLELLCDKKEEVTRETSGTTTVQINKANTVSKTNKYQSTEGKTTSNNLLSTDHRSDEDQPNELGASQLNQQEPETLESIRKITAKLQSDDPLIQLALNIMRLEIQPKNSDGEGITFANSKNNTRDNRSIFKHYDFKDYDFKDSRPPEPETETTICCS